MKNKQQHLLNKLNPNIKVCKYCTAVVTINAHGPNFSICVNCQIKSSRQRRIKEMNEFVAGYATYVGAKYSYEYLCQGCKRITKDRFSSTPQSESNGNCKRCDYILLISKSHSRIWIHEAEVTLKHILWLSRFLPLPYSRISILIIDTATAWLVILQLRRQHLISNKVLYSIRFWQIRLKYYYKWPRFIIPILIIATYSIIRNIWLKCLHNIGLNNSY